MPLLFTDLFKGRLPVNPSHGDEFCCQVDTLIQFHMHAFCFLVIIAYLNRVGIVFLLEAIELDITTQPPPQKGRPYISFLRFISGQAGADADFKPHGFQRIFPQGSIVRMAILPDHKVASVLFIPHPTVFHKADTVGLQLFS